MDDPIGRSAQEQSDSRRRSGTGRPRRSLFFFLVLAAAVLAALLWRYNSAPGQSPVPSSADSRRATPVLVSSVETGDLQLSSQYPGELDADISNLASKIAGPLWQVAVRIGDPVEKGAVVAVVDDMDLQRQLEEAQAQVAVAEANALRVQARLDEAEQELTRMEELSKAELVSTQDIEGVRATSAALQAELKAVGAQKQQSEARVRRLMQQIDETRIRAPFSGIVAERYLHPGAFVQPGTPIIRLVEAGPLRVRFLVPEEELAELRPGIPFELTTQSTGKASFTGQVTRLSGEVNRNSRTVAVDGILQTAGSPLRPGMYAEVRVARGRVRGKIVPGGAVLTRVLTETDEQQGVFVAVEDVAHWRRVRVLGREGDRVAVEGELADGDQVLVFGHQDLTDGARISTADSGGGAAQLLQQEREQP